MNGPLAQQSRSLQRCCLKQAQLTREAQRRLEEYVRRARAAGASWQAVGAALGITRQSAWERFRRVYAPRKNPYPFQKGRYIPEAVLQARHLQPNAFYKWVTEAAKTDMQVKQWFETPNIDLSTSLGYRIPEPPIKLLHDDLPLRGYGALKAFLMVASHDRATSVPRPESVTCLICGRSYLDDDFLRRHRTRDHPEIGRKATRQQSTTGAGSDDPNVIFPHLKDRLGIGSLELTTRFERHDPRDHK